MVLSCSDKNNHSRAKVRVFFEKNIEKKALIPVTDLIVSSRNITKFSKKYEFVKKAARVVLPK